MNTKQNAKKIGAADAKLSEIAEGIRKAWLKARDEAKKEIECDFKVGYIAGRERISLSEAEEIFAAGKGKGASAKHIAMIDRAVSGFRYHIAKGGSSTTTPTKHARISADLRKAAEAFLAEFDGETLNAQITQAIKVLQAMR